MNRKRTTREILQKNNSDEAPLKLQNTIICLHNIRSMHNVGAAFRCCDAFGVGKIILSGFTPIPPRPEITKTALGAEESVSWQYVKDIFTEIKNLKQNGYILAGIEQTTEALPLHTDLIYRNGRSVFFFGNEVTGLDEELLPLMDMCLEIPQFGTKHSLNISVTVGIVLYQRLLHSL